MQCRVLGDASHDVCDCETTSASVMSRAFMRADGVASAREWFLLAKHHVWWRRGARAE